ncbi:MAG: hypothetical protein JWM78_1200 [Verrucomicrobiaceae bacterium]|nr:hypothetical protein [Verrucomicrobiaceae bacterium]
MSIAQNNYREITTAVVLAGGLSTRMNSNDKALLMWRERTFIEHIVARLQTQVDRIAINTNSSDERLSALGLPILTDPFSDRRGPLAGILASLKYSATPLTLIVPCDNPMLSERLLERLAGALQNQNASIAYVTCAQNDYYLYALLRSDLHDNLERFLQTGELAVRRWYASESAIAVDFNDEKERFLNLNRPADLQLLPP